MKNSRLFKLPILAGALAIFTGCPALSNLMELIAREQAKPKKTLTITGIPSEYEGSGMMITAVDSTDTLGERLCLSGGDPSSRVVKDGKGKSLILEMNAKKMDTKISALVTLGKNLTGTAKSCDDSERFVILSFMGKYEEEKLDTDSLLMEKIMNDMFIYTKGVNICNASEDVLSKAKLTLSFSKMDTTLELGQFMRASDCEILTDIVRSALKGSEEYVVIKEEGLDVMKAPNSNDKIGNIAQGEIINVILPKKTDTIGNSLWTRVYYDDKGNKKVGWVIERTLPKTTNSTTKPAAMSNKVSLTVAQRAAPLRISNKSKVYYKDGKAIQGIFNAFTQATGMMPSLGTTNKYEMGWEQALPDIARDVILPTTKTNFMITKSPEDDDKNLGVLEGSANMVPNKWEEYIVIKETVKKERISYTDAPNNFCSYKEGDRLPIGKSIWINPKTGSKYGDLLWVMFSNSRYCKYYSSATECKIWAYIPGGWIAQKRYNNPGVWTVKEKYMLPKGVEEYIVIKEGGLDVMASPNGEKTGENIAKGKIIEVNTVASKKDKDGVSSWVEVYDEKDNVKGLVTKEEYINNAEKYIMPKNEVAVYKSKSYTVTGNEYKVYWYEADPEHIIIDVTNGKTAKIWTNDKKYGTNAGFFAMGTGNMIAFHIYDRQHLREIYNRNHGGEIPTGDRTKENFNKEERNFNPYSSMMYLKEPLKDGKFLLLSKPEYKLPFVHNEETINLENIIWGIGGLDLFIDSQIFSNNEYLSKFKETYKNPYDPSIKSDFPINDMRPRTAICYNDDRRIILATFFKKFHKEKEGTKEEVIVNDETNTAYTFAGPSFFEVRKIMKELGCAKALMLDGGGSSQISFNKNYIITKDGKEDVSHNGRNPYCRIRIKDNVKILWQE